MLAKSPTDGYDSISLKHKGNLDNTLIICSS